MREILFRGKQVGDGEWIEGYVFPQVIDGGYAPLCITTEPICANDYSEILGDWAIVDSSTVGQYTGLTDKNGKKIFEGDILQGFWYCEGVRAKVVWIDDAATFGILYSFRKSGEETAWLNSSWYKFTSESPCFPEIIGNIYDNPELLGGESDG